MLFERAQARRSHLSACSGNHSARARRMYICGRSARQSGSAGADWNANHTILQSSTIAIRPGDSGRGVRGLRSHNGSWNDRVGKMGANITERLARGGHTVWGYDSSPAAAADVAAKGVQIADALAQLTRKLSHP